MLSLKMNQNMATLNLTLKNASFVLLYDFYAVLD